MKANSKPQSKHIKVEEYKKCSDGELYQQECYKFFLKSIDHELCLQKIGKNSLSIFDYKRCYESNFNKKLGSDSII